MLCAYLVKAIFINFKILEIRYHWCGLSNSKGNQVPIDVGTDVILLLINGGGRSKRPNRGSELSYLFGVHQTDRTIIYALHDNRRYLTLFALDGDEFRILGLPTTCHVYIKTRNSWSARDIIVLRCDTGSLTCPAVNSDL